MKSYKIKDRKTEQLVYTVGNAIFLSVIKDTNNELIVLFVTNGTIVHSETFDTSKEASKFITQESSKISTHIVNEEISKLKLHVKLIEPVLLKQAKLIAEEIKPH